MRDTLVHMKDGTVHCGPIWEWKPSEGWFSIVLDGPDLPLRIRLADVASAVTKFKNGFERDEIVRACSDGWNWT